MFGWACATTSPTEGLTVIAELLNDLGVVLTAAFFMALSVVLVRGAVIARSGTRRDGSPDDAT